LCLEKNKKVNFMKIFPLKCLSLMDKANNLIKIAENYPVQKDETVEVLNSEFSKSELRSIYKNALKHLSHDKFDKTK